MEDIKAGEGRFYIGTPEDPLAEVLYVPGDEGIAITHTYVSEALRGRGVARQLVFAVVTLARLEKQKIIPICSYARNMLEGNEEFADVLVKGK